MLNPEKKKKKTFWGFFFFFGCWSKQEKYRLPLVTCTVFDTVVSGLVIYMKGQKRESERGKYKLIIISSKSIKSEEMTNFE